MLFSRVVSICAAFMSVGMLALANPVANPVANPALVAELAKRDTSAGVTTVLNDLKAKTDVILPQISALTSSGKVTAANVGPLILQLINELDAASGNLAFVNLPGFGKRQTADDGVADLLGGIVSSITDTLGGLLNVGSILSEVEVLVAGVDASLNQILVGVDTLLAGILNLVAGLLSGVVGILRSLALTLSLGTLGL